MASSPIFAGSPRMAAGQVSVANTNRDGTGTVVTIFSAGPNGSRIDGIDIVATVTTTAGVIRLFIHDGTNYRLWKEILVTAITPSASVAVFMSHIDLSDPDDTLQLPVGFSLRAATHNAEAINVIAYGGDY